MRPKRLIAAFLAICAAWAAHAAVPFDASVAGTSLSLPVPTGFTEPSSEAPILRTRAEQMTVSQMRLLAIYVDDSDLRAVQQGAAPNFRRYFMVSVLRGKEADTLDMRAFRAVKSEVTGQDQSAVDRGREAAQRQLDSAARSIGAQSGFPALSLKIGESHQLGVFQETDSSISTLAVIRVAASNGVNEVSGTMAQATSWVLLKGKVVLFAAYSHLDSDADYSWLREQSESWIQAALRSDSK